MESSKGFFRGSSDPTLGFQVTQTHWIPKTIIYTLMANLLKSSQKF